MNSLPDPKATATQSWATHLQDLHGPMVSGLALRKLLGFNDCDAMSRAIHAERVPVATFKLPGRQPHFAWTVDVAAWLTSLGAPIPAPQKKTPRTQRDAGSGAS